ncbi:smad nuclear interacting protein 1 [Mycena floridula]|nr:smad nuclear interacting protein 1 [Mycena floridula]
MPRDSRNSPSEHDRVGFSRRRHEEDDRRDRRRPTEESSRREHGESRRDRDRDHRREQDRYGYQEQDRERERQRDRERYDRDHRRDSDRAGPSSRRSGSPRQRSRSASPAAKKAKPNFGNSGLLAAETNTVKSVDGKNSTVLKYNEPPEARKPSLGWRLYVFKGEEQTDLMHINSQSAYLFGRDHLVADIPLDHPSCSKQHAAIQHRFIKEKDELGNMKGSVKTFIIDLESTNGTHVNDQPIPVSRYYELRAGDGQLSSTPKMSVLLIVFSVIKFGLSAREYVLLHDEAS